MVWQTQKLRMMETYEEIVAGLIKAFRPEIGDVCKVTSIQNIWFSQEIYPAVKAAIEKMDFGNIPNADRKEGGLRESLDISTFEDAAGNKYIATIYDNDDLWQDSKVLDIWRLD
jgi:hypothetical protein